MGWIALIVIGVILLIANATLPLDDTDNKTTKERSGLSLYKDHGTGCEYIAASTWFGLSRTNLVLRPGTCNAEKTDGSETDPPE